MKAVILSTLVVILPATALAQDPQIYKPGGDVTAPKLVRDVKPTYPPDAMQAGVTGAVKLECVVQPDGTVADIKVVQPLHPSIDEEAMKVLKQWSFTPGMKDGSPVPVRVDIEMTFSLRAGPKLDSAGVFKPGPDITLPKKLEGANPSYTPNAQEARIEGTVVLECVVLDNGKVGDIRVSKSLDGDLDAQAIQALRNWRFTPGQRDGRAVPVQVSVEMSFSLR
jgi:TonB family protein